MATAAALLGEDGRGYELARRLESSGTWRAWLGDTGYAAFAHALASPSAWEAFMSSRSQAHLHLQLRARALLFDKASASLFSPSLPIASPFLSNLNPSFLQLHGDDVYFSLEDDSQDGASHQMQSRPAISPRRGNEYSYERVASTGSRYNELESENSFQRHRKDEGSDTWYSQYMERYKKMKHHKFLCDDKEPHKRTSEGMSAYLKLSEIHKKRRQVFKEGNNMGAGEMRWDNGSFVHQRTISDMSNSLEEGNVFFPEIMFPANCVPDSALSMANGHEEYRKVEIYGVLDKLPDVISRSTAMMERFGIRPEHLKMGSKYRGKDDAGGNKKPLSQEQASQMSLKVSARLLHSVGFEGGTEMSMEVLSEFLGDHICKLGRMLKLLSDSYRKQFSSVELLKMFLQSACHINLATLVEITKDGSKGFTHQTQQQVRTLQSQHQNPLLQGQQQFQRPMNPNMLHPQTLTFQQQQQLQQWEKMRRLRLANAQRAPVMTMDKDQTMADVKLENIMDSPMDGSFSNINKQQLQLRQQMIMSNHHAQAGQQFKQLPHVQISQLQAAQNNYNSIRTPTVKIEAIHELLGGDSTIKHEPDQNKLMSPQK
ncbi:hypothetical protein J5N97_011057 [Dioscorea zingiberensis]|uniref:Bromodomain associated domain-containing protein n=1 Tax=Dioscorea zingiberensis TaxID=325984 RepID=A0A9D5HP76_9LILI|nr:hypothetical protein J5N97_011057 [Dioscorea zingiberensis]